VRASQERSPDKSSDHRRRGPRVVEGWTGLAELQKSRRFEVVLVDEAGSVNDVDAALVRTPKDPRWIARDGPSRILANVASGGSPFPVRPVQRARGGHSEFRTLLELNSQLHLVRPGKSDDQAVASLEDGTMVVVEHAGKPDRSGISSAPT
jgi:hypothetical protein